MDQEIDPSLAEHLNAIRELEAEVNEHASSAISFATNSFLDGLIKLLASDVRQNPQTLKKVIHATSSVYPYAFKTVCQNESESHMWQSLTVLKHEISNLHTHPNQGIKVAVVKFLQVVIMIQTRIEAGSETSSVNGISLAMVHPSHRILNVQQLENEGNAFLDILISMLHSDELTSTSLTAIISSFGLLLKKWSQLASKIIAAIIGLAQNPSESLPPMQLKNVEKTARQLFWTLLRTDPPYPGKNELLHGYELVGGNLAQFKPRNSSGSNRDREANEDLKRTALKRNLPQGEEYGGADKRLRAENIGPTLGSLPPAASSSLSSSSATAALNVLQSFDFSTLPVNVVIELVVGVLQEISQTTLDSIVATARQGQIGPSLPIVAVNQPNMTPTITNPNLPVKRDPRLRKDPRLQPTHEFPTQSPSSHTEHIAMSPAIIKEEEEEEKEEEAPRLNTYDRDIISQNQENSSTVEPVLKFEPGHSATIEPESFLTRQESPPLTDRGTQLRTFVLKAPPKLTSVEAKERMKQVIRRIFAAESFISVGSFASATKGTTGILTSRKAAQTTKNGWMLILARLGTRGFLNNNDLIINREEEDLSIDSKMDLGTADEELVGPDEMRQMIIDFVCQDFRDRSELALLWLYEEWYNDHLRSSGDPNYQPAYDKWLVRLINSILPELYPKMAEDQTYEKFFLDIPELSDEAVQFTRRFINAKDKDRIKVGIDALRNLILFRPANREAMLKILLSFCLNRDIKIRSTAIICVKKWVPDHIDIAPIVESFALNALNMLQSDTPPQYESGDEASASLSDWTELEVIRRMELFFALCTKKHELLKEIFNVYVKSGQFVQRVIRTQIFSLIKAIGGQSPKLLHVLRNFPEGGESLAIRILVVLTDTVRPSPELVKLVKILYTERKLDAKFLLPVFSGFTKDEIKQYLPKIIELLNNTESQQRVVKNVLSRILKGSQNAPAVISAQDLLVGLHELEDSVPLSKANEAIKLCFEMLDLFKSEVVAVVLQQLVDRSKIPVLFMVTMIRAVTAFPNLTGFVMNLLEKLVHKRVWSYAKLWDGFVKCVEKTQPKSFQIIATLPKVHLMDVLTRLPKILEPLREYAATNNKRIVLDAINEIGRQAAIKQGREQVENKSDGQSN